MNGEHVSGLVAEQGNDLDAVTFSFREGTDSIMPCDDGEQKD